MAPCNPSFLMTHSGIPAIQKRLGYPEAGLPDTRPEHIGQIQSNPFNVQDRQL